MAGSMIDSPYRCATVGSFGDVSISPQARSIVQGATPLVEVFTVREVWMTAVDATGREGATRMDLLFAARAGTLSLTVSQITTQLPKWERTGSDIAVESLPPPIGPALTAVLRELQDPACRPSTSAPSALAPLLPLAREGQRAALGAGPLAGPANGIAACAAARGARSPLVLRREPLADVMIVYGNPNDPTGCPGCLTLRSKVRLESGRLCVSNVNVHERVLGGVPYAY